MVGQGKNDLAFSSHFLPLESLFLTRAHDINPKDLGNILSDLFWMPS